MSRSSAQLSRQQRIETLLKKAENRVDKFDYEAAFKLCKKAYREDPQNVKILEQLASVACELGMAEDAKKYYEKLIEIAPDHTHVAYLELAQLAEDLESLGFYERGINLVRSKLDASEDAEARKALSRSLSEAYCSVAELFFTDLCDEPNAEDRCREAIELAITADSSNADAHRLLCQFYLIKKQLEDARNAMRVCLEKWHPRFHSSKRSENGTSMDDSAGRKQGQAEDSAEVETGAPDVSYAVRIECVKSLIELEMLEEADEALLSLLNEDDECASAWYLMGTTGYLEWRSVSNDVAKVSNGSHQTPKSEEEREELRKTSIRNLRKALRLTKRGDELDECALHEIARMLTELNAAQNSEMETDDNDMSDDEDLSGNAEADWETASGSDDDGEMDD